MASAVTKIDSNPLTQLLVLDLGGMTGPRTVIEFKERGADMGRETFIQQFSGTLSNVLLIGWVGGLGYLAYQGVHKLLGVNKQGIHAGSWINAKTMDAYAEVLEKAMAESASGPEARQKFLQQVLGNLQATDHVQARRVTDDVLEMLRNKDVAKAMREKISDRVRYGRLSEEALETLVKMYAPSDDMAKGSYRTYEYVTQWKNKQRLHRPVIEAAEKLIAKTPEWQALPKKHAMNLAFEKILTPQAHDELVRISQLVKRKSKAHVDKMVTLATEGGLTGTIDMVDEGGKTVLKDRNLKVVLGEIKYFLEQYVDRALADRNSGKLVSELTDKARATAMDRLYRKAEPGFLGRLLPHAHDGLITASRKAKFWLTAVPFVLAIAIAMSVAPFNNWLTKRKHGGKVFFPGEGGPPKGAGDQIFRSIRGTDQPVRGSAYGAFAMFEQQRTQGALKGGR